MNLSMTFITSF